MKLSLSTSYIIAFVLLAIAPATYADWLKVDMSVSGQGGGAPGFTSWDVVNAVTDTQTATFSGLTFTIRMTAPALDSTHYLKCGYNGKDGKTYNYKLAYDAIWPHYKPDPPDMPYPNGGSMSMTISGLSTGSHSIVTYHNNLWAQGTTPPGWDRANNMSNTKIYVDGVYIKTITPTYKVTSDAACGYAFFDVNAVSDTSVVISFVPDGTGTLDTVILNGFEIDAPGEPSALATAPVPTDGDLHVAANNDNPAPGQAANGYTTLSWTPSAFAVSHNVYYGTSQTDVFNATTTTPMIYKGNQTATTYPVTNLTSRLIYYWRIDEINAQGVTTKGAIWSFSPRRLAFPGAEGYGRFSRGGRGGKVIEVTNLLDSDPPVVGSYRYAIEQETGPRTVVFRVGGFIPLVKACLVSNGEITVAGQTAPGDGICIGRFPAGLYFSGAHDSILRYLRVRVGDYGQKSADAMGIETDNAIIDHCTLSWSLDVALSGEKAQNVTFQRCIISEALNNSYHYNGSHSFAASLGGNIASYHHNLIANCTGRNWSLAGGLTPSGKFDGYMDSRNNVFYNWRNRTNDGGCKATQIVNNYYKGGAATTLWMLAKPDGGALTDLQQCYITGNILDRPGYADNYETHNWDVVQCVTSGITNTDIRVNTPFWPDYVTTHTATGAYNSIVGATNATSDVGANRPKMDSIDARILNEVRNRTYTYVGSVDGLPGIIDSQDDVGGYPTWMQGGPVPADSDHDGLPDWWETTKGLNPNSPAGDFSDSNGDPDADGYTNLEDYLNYLAAGGRTCGMADLDNNCQVDFKDFAILAGAWAGTGSADVDRNGVLNYLDLATLAQDWLSCNNSVTTDCWQ
jgi:hypothetical protein